MKKCIFAIVLLAGGAHGTYALNSNDLKEISAAVVEMCATPSKQGEILKVEGDAKVGAPVLVRLVGANLEGKLDFERWNGISMTLDKYSTDPRACAIETLKILVPAFKGEDKSSSTQIDINGRWRDPNWGTMSQITQQGETFHFTSWGPSCLGGTFQSSGSGTIKGNFVESRYQSLIQSTIRSEGSCSGTVSRDGMQMTSTCNDSVCGQFTSSGVRQ